MHAVIQVVRERHDRVIDYNKVLDLAVAEDTEVLDEVAALGNALVAEYLIVNQLAFRVDEAQQRLCIGLLSRREYLTLRSHR